MQPKTWALFVLLTDMLSFSIYANLIPETSRKYESYLAIASVLIVVIIEMSINNFKGMFIVYKQIHSLWQKGPFQLRHC